MAIDYSGKGRLAGDADSLVRAFEGALRELALDRTDPRALIVAEHIINFAKAGGLNPMQLRDLTVKAVGVAHGGVRRRAVNPVPD